MMDRPARVTVVVPCYNEARRLDREAYLTYRAPEWLEARFLFVDDGSTDDTAAVLAALSDYAAHVRVETLPANRGKGEAVRRGMLRALEDGPDVVAYWDADLSTPLSMVAPLCEELLSDEDLQAVIGSRVRLLGRRIERRATRHYVGRVFATAASLALRLPVYDTQCGAKVFRASERLADCLAEPFRSSWVFDVELIGRLTAAERRRTPWLSVGCSVHEYALPEWVHAPGSSVRPRDALRAAYDLARIWWEEGKRLR